MLFMVIPELVENLTRGVSYLSPELANNLEGFITILKAVGIIFIIYVIYSIIMAIINARRLRLLNKLDKRVDNIERKINIILKNVKKKK